MNDFIEGVKEKLKSRSTIYALLFLTFLIVQQIYQAYQSEQAEQQETLPVQEQKD